MTIFYKNIILLSLILPFFTLEAQIAKDDCFINKNEKVYIHLAKDVLVAGENLIYKAFLVNASSLKSTFNQSKILYFELSDNNNKRILFWRNNVSNNGCSGQVLIPDTLKGGIYNLRAYTNWMRNFDKSYYFRTNIIVTSLSDKKLYFEQKTKANSSVIEIFPEGGKIINDIVNKLTIKYNSNLNLTASIVNQAGEILSEEKINSLSLASLSFTPHSNNQYSIIIKDSAQNTISQKTLDAIELSGKKLSVSKPGNQFLFTINSYGNVTGKNRLIVRCRGKVQLDTSLVQSMSVTSKRFAQGVLHAAIINERNEIISQNLFYNPLTQPVGITLSGLTGDLSQNKDYKTSIVLENAYMNEKFDLSLSIASHCKIPELHTKEDMNLYFNLFSELIDGFHYRDSDTAYINDILASTDPDHYFWGKTDNQNTNCNYLMEDKGYILQGKLSDRVSGLPLSNSIITLSYPDSIPQLNYTITDSAGGFSFLLKQNFDNKQLYLQLPYADASNLNVKWEFDSKDGILYPVEESSDSARSSNSFVENYRNIQLVNAIYNNGLHCQNPDTIKLISRPFYYENGTIVNTGDYLELVDFKEISDNLLMGLSFKTKNNNYSINLIDPDRQSYFTEQATVFLNGVIFTNLDYISKLGSKEILNVELIKSQIFYSDLTFYGLVLIRTKDGKVPSAELNDLSIIIRNEVAPEFSGKSFVKPLNKQPDFRTLMLFENNLVLKKEQVKEFSFSTPLLENDIEFKVQGISSEGRVVSYSLIKNLK